MRDTPLENTGLINFLKKWKNLAIAHKLWGDNMGLIEANRKVIEIILATWSTQSFSVSAFRSSAIDFNTTDHLIQAWESETIQELLYFLSKVEDFHTELLEVILQNSHLKLKTKLIDYAKNLFNEYKTNATIDTNLQECTAMNDYTVGIWEKAFSLLSVWEVIAAKVLVMYLKECWIPAVYVDTANMQNIWKAEVDRKVGAFLQSELENIWSKDPNIIPIIPGYIWGIDWWIIAKLWRWYTDYTGERTAVAKYDMNKFHQVLLYIQKLYGFKSTDPRVLSESGKAKSVNHLSYDLTKRAISKKWAWAWLINEFALSRDVIKRSIAILVGNPTNDSDIAIIDENGNSQSNGVNLVLGRDYSDKNDWREYGRKWGNWWESNHNVYLMGENIGNIGWVYADAKDILKKHKLEEIAGKTSNAWKPETSFVFRSKSDALKAQRILHQHFIENRSL